MPLSHFEYLAWVRKKQRAAKFPLTFSGITPPQEALFSPTLEDLSLDNTGVFTALHRAISTAFDIPVESLFSCTGTTGGVFTVLAALLSPGDTIVVEHPTYELLEGVPKSLGAKIIPLPRRFEDGYRVREEELQRALSYKPKVVLLANPHNPSGVLLSSEEMKVIVEASHKVGALVVVDEVYLPFSCEKSAYHLGAITISSPTKVSGLGDLRIGWIFAPARFIAALQDATDMSGGYVSLVSARMMTRALGNWPALCARGIASQQRGLPLIKEFIASQPRLSWVEPVCGIIGFVCLNGVEDASQWIDEALDRFDVGVVPGRYFGDARGFRLGFGLQAEILTEGLRRLSLALAL
jgi:aspartate/methionine/tyrosine aminotransferase